MQLAVHSVVGKGDLEKEFVWIEVKEDIPDLAYYMLCDTTFIEPNNISNELRHVYWFRSREVKKGSWIQLWSKSGTNTSSPDDKGVMVHRLYWGLGVTVWNKTGDRAVLFNLRTWLAKAV